MCGLKGIFTSELSLATKCDFEGTITGVRCGLTLSLRPSKHLFGLVRLGRDRAFRWSGAGAASWCLALVAVGFPYFAGTHKGHPYESRVFFRRRGRPQGCAPTVFFQYPMANIQCPMSKFFGRWFFGVGFGFSRLRGYPQGAPLQNRGFFRRRGQTHRSAPTGLSSVCLRFAEVFFSGCLMFLRWGVPQSCLSWSRACWL